MRGVYTAEIEIASLSAGKTALHLAVPSDLAIEILAARITNMSVDTNEQLEAGVFDITTNGSPTGTAVTPTKHENGDVASSVTVLGDLTAEPTTYASKGYDRQGFSNLGGYHYDPIPEERPVKSPGSYLGLRLLSAPATAFKAACEITFREIGG